MQTENNKKMNFQEYVRWALLENKGTIQNYEERDLHFLSVHELDGDEMGQVIWLFRRCQSKNMLDRQDALFLMRFFILGHIINFLLTIIHYKQPTQEQIYRLMNSIGIIEEQEELQLVHLEENELLSIEYEREVVQQLKEINQEDFQKLFQAIFELKEISSEQYKKIDDLKMLFNQEFSSSGLKCQFGYIMAEINQYQKNNFQQITQIKLNQSRIKLQKQKVEQAEKRKLQQKSQSKLEFIKFSKVIYGKQSKTKILLGDGRIVNGNIWISYQDQYCIPLSVSLQTQVEYFNQCIEYMNEDELFRKDLTLSYQGPVNNNLDPNVIKSQYELGIEGILIQNREGQCNQYRGCFRDGLFDDIGRIYLGNTLYYFGEYRVGIKHGKGHELQNRDGDYLEGNFDRGRKDGVFQFLKLIDGQKWVVDKSKPKKIYKYGQEIINPNQEYQFELKRQSSSSPSRALMIFGDYGINNFQLQSLQPGRWLNSNIIDIVIKQIQTLRLQIKENYINDNNTVFINCNEFQDIFGSIITKDQDIQTEIFKQLINSQNKKQPLRFVFYFNLDRGHFLSVVYENQKLYLIDSLQDKKIHLLYQMKKLLNFFNFKVQDDWQDCQVSQQNNAYDCGMYTNIHLSIPEMIQKQMFNVEQSRINYIRYLIAKNFPQFGIELLKI